VLRAKRVKCKPKSLPEIKPKPEIKQEPNIKQEPEIKPEPFSIQGYFGFDK
jgi:hypothetical protein